MSQGAQAILDIAEDHKENAVFLTDSKSVLDALSCHGEYTLRVKLSKLLESRRVVLQWIPAHCGISGNEQADELAKRAAHSLRVISAISVSCGSVAYGRRFDNNSKQYSFISSKI